MELGHKFKALREAKGMSVYKLSKMSDVSENHIHTVEKKGTQPSVATLEKLLSCLGTTIAEFLNEGGDAIYPTEFERDLVESVRLLDEEKATAVLHLAKLLAK